VEYYLGDGLVIDQRDRLRCPVTQVKFAVVFKELSLQRVDRPTVAGWEANIVLGGSAECEPRRVKEFCLASPAARNVDKGELHR